MLALTVTLFMKIKILFLATMVVAAFQSVYAQPISETERRCVAFSRAVQASQNAFAGKTGTDFDKLGYTRVSIVNLSTRLFDGGSTRDPSLLYLGLFKTLDDARVATLASRVLVKECSPKAVEKKEQVGGFVEYYAYKVPIGDDFATVAVNILTQEKDGSYGASMIVVRGSGTPAAAKPPVVAPASSTVTVGKSTAAVREALAKIYDLTNFDKDDEALALANAVIAANPKNATAFGSRARVFFNLQKYADASADIAKALQFEPKNATAIFARGLIKRNDRDYKGAIADLDEALRIAPDLKIIYRYRAKAKYLLDQPISEVLADYDLAIAAYPLLVGMHIDAGDACNRDNGPYLRCAAYFEGARRMQPSRHEAIFGWAEAYYWELQSDRATPELAAKKSEVIAAYRTVATGDPKYPNVHRRLGMLYYDIDDFDSALRELDLAISQKPEAFTYRLRGHTYKVKRQYEAAIADYDKALALDPKDQVSTDARQRAVTSLEGQRAAASRRAAAAERKQAKEVQVLKDFDDLVERLEYLDGVYASASDKLRRAVSASNRNGVDVTSFYKGTHARAQGALDEAHRLINAFLKKHGNSIDSESRATVQSWKDRLPTSVFAN